MDHGRNKSTIFRMKAKTPNKAQIIPTAMPAQTKGLNFFCSQDVATTLARCGGTWGCTSRISAAVLATRCCHSGVAERCRSRDSRKCDAIPPISAVTLDQIATVVGSCETESDAETPNTPPIRKPATNRPKAVRRHRTQIVSTMGFIRLTFQSAPTLLCSRRHFLRARTWTRRDSLSSVKLPFASSPITLKKRQPGRHTPGASRILAHPAHEPERRRPRRLSTYARPKPPKTAALSVSEVRAKSFGEISSPNRALTFSSSLRGPVGSSVGAGCL